MENSSPTKSASSIGSSHPFTATKDVALVREACWSLFDRDAPARYILCPDGPNGRQLHWPFDDRTIRSLCNAAKARRGRWNPSAKAWVFPSTVSRDDALRAAERLSTKHAWGYQVFRSHAARKAAMGLIDVRQITVAQGVHLLSFPSGPEGEIAFRAADGRLGIRVGDRVFIEASQSTVTKLRRKGYRPESMPAEAGVIGLRREGWLLTITAGHEQVVAMAFHVATELSLAGGVARCIVSDESLIVDKLNSWGLPFVQSSTASTLCPSSDLTSLDRIPGWETPSQGGYMLRPFQRDAVLFFAAHGGRIILADDMGTGKTAEAIACANSVSARRVLVVCPAGLKALWAAQIQAWTGESAEMTGARAEPFSGEARWVIVSYEGLVTPTRRWRCRSRRQAERLMCWLQGQGSDVHLPAACGSMYGPKRVAMAELTVKSVPLNCMPPWFSSEEAEKWRSICRSCKNPLLDSLNKWAPDCLLVDEAHRAKNCEAARSAQIIRLSRIAQRVLLLTGTPVRNSADDATNLVRVIDPTAAALLESARGAKALKKILPSVMLRRRADEVLSELPPRRAANVRIHVNAGSDYARCLEVIREGGPGPLDTQARDRFSGGAAELARMRHALGDAKAQSPEVIEMLDALVEAKTGAGRGVVIFAHHHSVSAAVAAALQRRKIRAELFDGTVAQGKRDRVVAQFQAGKIQVLVMGLQAGGEGLSLTRADTAVFLELAWVPAELAQGEGRIRRIGQEASCCEYLYVLADTGSPGDNVDEIVIDVLTHKTRTVNYVLDEKEPCPAALTEGEVAKVVLAKLRGRPETDRR